MTRGHGQRLGARDRVRFLLIQGGSNRALPAEPLDERLVRIFGRRGVILAHQIELLARATQAQNQVHETRKAADQRD